MKQFERDIKSVTKGDPLTDKLIWQRNNIYSHLNFDNVLNDAIHPPKNMLPHREFKRLLDRADRIINRYSQKYIRNIWSMTIARDRDYMHVLGAQKDWSRNYERKLREEERKYRREARRKRKT